ncbi:hypothetical protein [Aquimarina sp. AU119]|uniref:hypothetical protein n=1 Tax=Aquimarina sp. AU119 TaxID=2108528 RepID=UPI00135857CF|nr:hypothetical protein [Aquimarina sp. AU119]
MEFTLKVKDKTLFVNGKEVSKRTIKNNEAGCTDIMKVIAFCRAADEIDGINFKFD